MSSQRTAIGKKTLVMATAIIVLGAGVVVLVTVNQMSPSITSSPSSTITTLSPNPGGSTTQTTGNASTPCPSDTTCASSFTYDSSVNQVMVNSVQATEFVCNNCGAVNGQSYVTFAVNLENIGLPHPSACSNCEATIDIEAGTGGLIVSAYPSSVLQSAPSQQCAGTSTIVALEYGQNYTMYGPGCDAGFDYQLVQPGSITLTFLFHWTMSNQASGTPELDTVITAQFSFA